MLKIKHRGRPKGEFGAVAAREDYPKLAAMAAEGWTWGYIGRKFGITGTRASRIVRDYTEEQRHGIP
jgi:hypothetical protein